MTNETTVHRRFKFAGRFAAWVFDNVPMPAFAQPYVFGLIIGRWPRKVKGDPEGSPRGSCLECGWVQNNRHRGSVNDQ